MAASFDAPPSQALPGQPVALRSRRGERFSGSKQGLEAPCFFGLLNGSARRIEFFFLQAGFPSLDARGFAPPIWANRSAMPPQAHEAELARASHSQQQWPLLENKKKWTATLASRQEHGCRDNVPSAASVWRTGDCSFLSKCASTISRRSFCSNDEHHGIGTTLLRPAFG